MRPFLALRSYLPSDHPDKGKEIGSEATPAEFIDVLLRVTQELRRVLAPHGSIAVELGDTYAGSGGAGGDYGENGWREGQEAFGGSGKLARYSDDRGNPDGMRDPTFSGANTLTGGGGGWPLAKSKALIAELYRVALAYGFDPLTGTESPAGRWRVRNVVTWARPNPPVGALGDKWRPATSDVVVACTSEKRYWDDLATRRPADPANKRPSLLERKGIGGRTDQVMNPLGEDGQRIIANSAGAPLLDYWEIPPTGYSGSHYAVFPPALVEPCVKAMGPQRVCRECGEPSRALVDRMRISEADNSTRIKNGAAANPRSGFSDDVPEVGWEYHREVKAWSDCGHNDWRRGLVLDPFAGSGTTLLVASGHGLDSIGIDLDERNAELALERVGPLLLEVSS